jgi:hypothetical protein
MVRLRALVVAFVGALARLGCGMLFTLLQDPKSPMTDHELCCAPCCAMRSQHALRIRCNGQMRCQHLGRVIHFESLGKQSHRVVQVVTSSCCSYSLRWHDQVCQMLCGTICVPNAFMLHIRPRVLRRWLAVALFGP